MINAVATISRTLSATATITYTSPPGNCTYRNSDNTFNQSIDSGDVFIAPDVDIIDNLGNLNIIPANKDFTAPPVGDTTYKNSDDTFIQVIPTETIFVAPDVNITDNFGNVTILPANKDFVAITAPIAYIQLGYPENSTVFTVGDAGTQLALGTYDKTTIGVRPILVDNDTLSATTPNAFGNTLVWTDELGTQIYANNYAINHYLNLGVFLIESQLANWAASITFGDTSNAYIYNDWRLMSGVEQAFFIRTTGSTSLYDFSPLDVFVGGRFWSCESAYSVPSNFALHINMGLGISSISKSSGLPFSILVRNHF